MKKEDIKLAIEGIGMISLVVILGFFMISKENQKAEEANKIAQEKGLLNSNTKFVCINGWKFMKELNIYQGKSSSNAYSTSYTVYDKDTGDKIRC